jgi:hypothetical protein
MQADSAEVGTDHQEQPKADAPILQSITTSSVTNRLTQDNIDFINQHGGRLFGLDSCASHTFTDDLSLLIDPVTLPSPIPLNVAPNGTQSFVTVVGKMNLKNKTGSITINNVYYSPDVSCTLLSAKCLCLGGGRIKVEDCGNVAVSFPCGFSLQSFCLNCRWQIPALVKPRDTPSVFVPPAILSSSYPPLKSNVTLPALVESFNTSLKDTDALLWHLRLGHISLKQIIKMCASGQAGLPKVLTNKEFTCEDCLVSKSK